jgi:hypothetical protein
MRILGAVGLGLFTFVAAVIVGSPAFGQDQVTWECSAENGQYSENPQSISPSVHTLTGRIQFQSGQFGDQWNPVAHIAFTDSSLPTNADCFCNGLRAEINPGEPDTVRFFMTFNGQSALIAQSPVGRPITFRLSIDDAGVLTVVIGKTHPTMKTARLIRPQRDTVHMSCSSGDVSFLDVQAE